MPGFFSKDGGGFATIPAYLADLFGTHHVGGSHGRLLTAWSVADILGRLAITTLRQHSLRQASTTWRRRSTPSNSRQPSGRRPGNSTC